MASWLPSQYAWAQPQANPLSGIGSALGRHPNLLLGLGAGLLSGNLGAAPQAIAAGAQADNAYAASKQADAERLDQINKTSSWLKQNYPQFASLPPAEGFQLATQLMSREAKPPVDPTNTYQGRMQVGQEQGLDGQALTEYALTGKLPGGNQTTRAGVGQPIYGKNKQTGAIEPWQSMTDGTMVNIANPQADPSQYDFNPGVAASERTNATVDAKSAAAARAMLPGAQQAFDMANKAADTLLSDTSGMQDQFGNTLGFPNQMMPMARPGSDMARFRTELEQGQGNAFLQARQVLKGAGQVTDYEGAKAEAAYSRMALAAKNNNQDEFVAAVTEFKQAVAEGYAKLQAAAQGDYAAGGPGVTGQGGGNVTSSGIQWSVSP